MWPKEIFDLKRSGNSEERLKQLIAEKSKKYLRDYVHEREVSVDIPVESV